MSGKLVCHEFQSRVRGWHEAPHDEEAVNLAFGNHQVAGHSRCDQPVGVGLAFVPQDVMAGKNYDRRRLTSKAGRPKW